MILLHPQKITPQQSVLEQEGFFIQSNSGNQIHVLDFHPNTADSTAVLYFHGNSQNNYRRQNDYKWLNDYGFSVYMVDYSGFGKSTGKASVEASIEDVRSVIQHFQSDTAIHSFHIIATSIGGSFVMSAIEPHSDSSKIDKVVIDCSFMEYEEVGKHHLKRSIVGYPFAWLPRVLWPERLSPLNNLQAIKTHTILVSACEKDEAIPIHESRRVHHLLPGSEYKEFSVCKHSSTFKRPKNREWLVKWFKSQE